MMNPNNERIETRLIAYNKRENIELFFETVELLINELGITEDNPRLCLNVRNESNRQRISLNLNSRLIGGLRNVDGKDIFLIMLYNEDAKKLENNGIALISKDENFNDIKDLPQAQTYYIDDNVFTEHQAKLINFWLKCCKDYYPKYQSSTYRKHNIPELFKLATNKEFRNIELDKILNKLSDIDKLINSFINDSSFQKIINSEEFYFSELSKLFKEYEGFDISDFVENLNELTNEEIKDFSFQKLLDANIDNLRYYNFLLLIGKMISIFDEKGYNKAIWNPYLDKRIVSRAQFTQQKWTYCFVRYKLNNLSFTGLDANKYSPFKYSIDYIINPQLNVCIASTNHRNQICKYFKLENDVALISLFSNYTDSLKNPLNIGVFITCILYNPNVKKLWLDSIKGLMAADGTNWQDNYIKQIVRDKNDALIIWNSKNPTGTNETFKQLRDILTDEGHFNYYYASKNLVNYKAKVVDFVTNQNELTSKNWQSFYENIADYDESFDEYKDNNKRASIIFIAEKLEKIKPIPIEQFEFYKSSRPTQDNISPIKSEPENIVPITSTNDKKAFMQHPLNQIFYGSPGTGKTFNTINYALSIIENKPLEELENESRADIKKRYDVLVNEGRIVFTTFHQSMNYEDFIEGIKPIEPKEEGGNITYKVVNGIFKSICEIADSRKGNLYNVLENLKADTLEDEGKTPITIKLPNTTFDVKYKGGTVFYVSPHNTTKQNPWYPVSIDFIEQYFNTGNIAGIYNYTYVKGIVEYLLKNKGLTKGRNEGIENKPYVLIIDEINRGNVSAIFGELITLIETDKRIGKNEALEVTLPYSKQKFGVPSNLYIIGTMNTADRSVEALDTALRRRFHFTEMQPQSDILYFDCIEKYIAQIKKMMDENLEENEINLFDKNFEELLLGNHTMMQIMQDGGEDLINSKVNLSDIFIEKKISLLQVKILEIVNKRIEYLLDRDHTIGHSFFMCVMSIEDLKDTFFKNIIPLLQEYFYGDYAKMSLVIGDDFFEIIEINNKPTFAKVKNEIDVADKEIYILRTKESFEDNNKFKSALLNLINA